MQTIRKLAVLAAATLACGGALAQSEIEAIERGVVVPSLRVGIDIAPRGFQAPSRGQTGHAIELGISGASAEDRQDLRAGAPPVVFGGRTFGTPTQLSHEFDFGFAEIAYRYRNFFGWGEFGIEALGGLGFAELELTVASPTQRASEKLSSGGLVAGFGIVWKFLSDTSLQSRLTVFASGERDGVTGAARFDLHFVQALGSHAALRVGYVGWGVVSSRADFEDDPSINSHIRAGFSGLSLGLDVMF